MSDSHRHEGAGHDHGEDHDHGDGDDSGHRHDHGKDHDGGGGHAHDDHEHHAHDVERLGYAVVTVSSTRGYEDDPAGDAIESIVEGAGDEVVVREVVNDDFDGVQGTVNRLVDRDDVDCIVTTGGTGVTPDDVTVEAVTPLFDKELPGFGELFRSMSRDEIGTMVVGTRATAGVVGGVLVFCLPGSENAARLGSGEIIVEEAGHLAGLARRE
ncbi:molybdenum cofactor biosynthesis protein B [Halobaculum sp. WSA2]|uniref:Molybdenum cofactor biosynthesis protein B n=1 Tax=Halobaculum saliterrae TaxID=2073113 RepID=A0A6B0SSY5_9EURY|nr:MogA/MoaB family molybdenum cofactor biosynthesis protein [Halobaculum saliterrae]MXR39791.1 molybdenum cofactor biosynthesis protein B [Halobaculum saliterrae]